MKQYQLLLNHILNHGSKKDGARDGVIGTTSVFGYQTRFNLSDGFPILTTKEIRFDHIVNELLWFLRGDTNIKFLVDRNCNIWNEDSYNYYLKMVKKFSIENEEPPLDLLVDDPSKNCLRPFTFQEFVENIKNGFFCSYGQYKLGDCGKQYGWLWRTWKSQPIFGDGKGNEIISQGNRYVSGQVQVDQIQNLIKGLMQNPMSRRHIVTAWNPTTLDDMALNACHSFFQFNCRPISWEEKLKMAKNLPNIDMENLAITEAAAGNSDFGFVPQYYLDCHLYQRSADAFLGVPYNISSYSLLIHLISNMCNMIPGEFIHSFGDLHIYDNHLEQVNTILKREPLKLPTLNVVDLPEICDFSSIDLSSFFNKLSLDNFSLSDYNPMPSIKAKLNTGLK